MILFSNSTTSKMSASIYFYHVFSPCLASACLSEEKITLGISIFHFIRWWDWKSDFSRMGIKEGKNGKNNQGEFLNDDVPIKIFQNSETSSTPWFFGEMTSQLSWRSPKTWIFILRLLTSKFFEFWIHPSSPSLVGCIFGWWSKNPKNGFRDFENLKQGEVWKKAPEWEIETSFSVNVKTRNEENFRS